MIARYERVAALRAERDERPSAVLEPAAALAALHDELAADHPREWLLRWNLLELSLRVPGMETFAHTLAGELEALELAFERREPIAMGLEFLRRRS